MTGIQGVIETASIHSFEMLKRSLTDEFKILPSSSKFFLGGFPPAVRL